MPVRRRRAPPRQSSFSAGIGFRAGFGQRAARDRPADYEAFERLLGDIQAAWSNEDVASCIRWRRRKWCPISTGSRENKARNVVNKVSGIKLLQGDLAEAWREGETDYASVAMRFSLIDKTRRSRQRPRSSTAASSRTEVTEVWTFAAAARRQLGIVGDPADQLIARDRETTEAPRFDSAAPFFVRRLARAGIMSAGVGVDVQASRNSTCATRNKRRI